MTYAGINDSRTVAVRFPAPLRREVLARRKVPGGEMCKLLATQDPQRFRQTSRSLRISGQSTSIRLEAAFWETLEAIAANEGVPVSRLVAIIHEEALDSHGDVSNFASLLRTVCLIYQTERAEQASRLLPPA